MQPTAYQQGYQFTPGSSTGSYAPGYGGTTTPAGYQGSSVQGSANFNPLHINVVSPNQNNQYTGGQQFNTANQSTTTLSNGNAMNNVSGLNQNMDNVSNKGITTDANGTAHYADGSIYQSNDSNTTTPNPLTDTHPEDQSIQSIMDEMKSSTDAQTKAQIDNIQQKFNQRKQEQADVNARNLKGVQTSLLMGGVTGQGSSAQFAPISSQGIVTAQESYGIKQLASLDSDENDAIAQARQAQSDQNYKLMEAKLADVQKIRDQKLALAADLNKTATEKNAQAKTDTAISNLYSQGITEPGAIATKLSAQGLDVPLKTISDTVGILSGVGGTGIVGEYNFYKADALKRGQTPVDFNTYQNIDANRKAKVASAGVSSLGGVINSGNPEQALGDGKDNGSILNQTGLSLPAFNYLTQGTGALTRMNATDRARIMKESQDFLNKKGIDVSTFQSQYKAYNDVLQKNIARANQTAIMAGEVSGSADALISAIDEKDMGNIKAKNILKLAIGEQVNDPTTQKYNFQLKAMANDLAGYFAAARGASSPELQDQRDAAEVIANGMSKRNAQAFKDSVNSNEEKVSGVVKRAVESTQKQVWGLFGVADKYKAPSVGGNTGEDLVKQEDTAKQKVISFGKTNSKFQPILLKKINEINPVTGHKYTYMELQEIYPEIK